MRRLCFPGRFIARLSQIFVGIDVSKALPDIALRPTGERWALANDDFGMAALVERLQARQPRLLVLEATGGYQRAVVTALAAAGLPVAVRYNPVLKAFYERLRPAVKAAKVALTAWMRKLARP